MIPSKVKEIPTSEEASSKTIAGMYTAILLKHVSRVQIDVRDIIVKD